MPLTKKQIQEAQRIADELYKIHSVFPLKDSDAYRFARILKLFQATVGEVEAGMKISSTNENTKDCIPVIRSGWLAVEGLDV